VPNIQGGKLGADRTPGKKKIRTAEVQDGKTQRGSPVQAGAQGGKRGINDGRRRLTSFGEAAKPNSEKKRNHFYFKENSVRHRLRPLHGTLTVEKKKGIGEKNQAGETRGVVNPPSQDHLKMGKGSWRGR